MQGDQQTKALTKRLLVFWIGAIASFGLGLVGFFLFVNSPTARPNKLAVVLWLIGIVMGLYCCCHLLISKHKPSFVFSLIMGFIQVNMLLALLEFALGGGR